MSRIIWSWSADDERAADLTRRLEQQNPGWSVRVLTETSIGAYVDLSEVWPGRPERAQSQAALGVLRLMLLHEYGGVWVEPGVDLLEPLSDWIDAGAADGFFAFADVAGRPLPALLAAAEGHHLMASWLLAALRAAGDGRALEDDWLERAFDDAAERDPRVRAVWDAVARLPLHDAETEVTLRSSTAPAVRRAGQLQEPARTLQLRTPLRAVQCAGLSVSTQNVGDHIQILGLEDILRRQGLAPTLRLDRDRDLAGGDWLRQAPERLPMLINGWLMHRPAAWPPHPRLDAALFGVFFQIVSAPHLVGPAALEYYATRPPVGCRDPFTMNLLRSRGVEAYLSHCASMGMFRRLPDARQTETFVVAPDDALVTALRADSRFITAIGGEPVALSHYTESRDFEVNTALARDLLSTYRTRARLIVTSMLHCALPAIAMGIPVVVITPLDLYKHETDVARLSDLARFVRIFDISELDHIDWSGYLVQTGELKLAMVDRVRDLVASWGGTQAPEPAASAAAPSGSGPLRIAGAGSGNGGATHVNGAAPHVNGFAPHPAREQRDAPASQRIPKLFHRIWLGGPMPDEYVRFGESWLEHHPGWELRTWSERDLTELRNRAHFDAARNDVERADIARYEILLRHGGVYLDADVECLANIEPLIADVDGFVGMSDGTTLGTAVVGAVPEHPFIARLVAALPRSYDNHRREIPGEPVWFAQSARCGAVFVTREYHRARPQLSDEALRVLPAQALYPRRQDGEAPEGAFARHHVAGGWLPEPAGADARVAAQPIRIPRVFHRVWLGGPMPEEVRRWGETWLEHNPGWTMRTWGYEDLRDLVNQSHFDNARNYSEQSDFARYEILLRHGGVYLDTDFECYRNIEPLLAGLDAFLACEDDALVCGAIVGATPGHPLIRELVERLPGSYDAYPGSEPRLQSERCGPRFVSRVYEELRNRPELRGGLHVYPPEYFYPHLWWERERSAEPSVEAYARHYWEASWVPDTTAPDGAPADGAPADGAPADGAPADGEAGEAGTPSRDVVVVLAPDQSPDDWPALAGTAHLLVGTGAKLTIAAPPELLTPGLIDNLREIDERLGGTIEMELTDTSRLDGDAGLVTPLADAAGAVCEYLRRTGRAWLPVHGRASAQAAPDPALPEPPAIAREQPQPLVAVASQPVAQPVAAAPQPAVPEADRIRRLAQLELPDVKRWGDIESYPQGWNPRAHLAAELIDDHVKLLEIGVGAGYLRSIVEDRVRYSGVDLAPVVPDVLQFNLETDELPESHYDCIVALGVLEYVHDLPRAVSLLTGGADCLVLSYCFAEPGFQGQDYRLGLGWVNGLQESELFELFAREGFSLRARRDYNSGQGWHQSVFRLEPQA